MKKSLLFFWVLVPVVSQLSVAIAVEQSPNVATVDFSKTVLKADGTPWLMSYALAQEYCYLHFNSGLPKAINFAEAAKSFGSILAYSKYPGIPVYNSLESDKVLAEIAEMEKRNYQTFYFDNDYYGNHDSIFVHYYYNKDRFRNSEAIGRLWFWTNTMFVSDFSSRNKYPLIFDGNTGEIRPEVYSDGFSHDEVKMAVICAAKDPE